MDLRGVVAIAVTSLAAAAFEHWRRKRQALRARTQYLAAYRPDRVLPQFEPLIPLAAEVLGAEIVRAPEVQPSALAGRGPAERLDAALALCVSRFRLEGVEIVAAFARLPADRGAEVTWEYATALQKVGDTAELQESTVIARWLVRVSLDARSDDTLLLALISHELAHIVLKRHGVWLDDYAANELLTETTAVLAGFGPVMLGAALTDDFVTHPLGWREPGGYLHEETIRFLMSQRSTLTSQTVVRDSSPPVAT